ncbi:MAG: dihydroneopterin aldolase [Flavobacteriaceae bacterium]|nr:dihydroneopterin aldolase [Flavobacteriaceae bacterium]MDZ4147907.1 dihydroneopterin aldolase [Flavobacteriaceae bacterium]
MGIIRLENIRLYAYHGCLEEEGKIGSDYRVDVKTKADLKQPATTDSLKDTVDYVHLHHIVKEEMAIRSKLLETVAQRIINRMLAELPIEKAVVKISKINPPIGGDVRSVSVSLKGTREK